MQVGFVMLESGFARSRETVNIMVEGIADTCICGVTFWLWGFVVYVLPRYPMDRDHGIHAARTAGHLRYHRCSVARVLGFPVCLRGYLLDRHLRRAMIGRCDFIGDLLYSVGVTGFIYPIIGHLAWGPDVMAGQPGSRSTSMTSRDPAVVHTIGGMISPGWRDRAGTPPGPRFQT